MRTIRIYYTGRTKQQAPETAWWRDSQSALARTVRRPLVSAGAAIQDRHQEHRWRDAFQRTRHRRRASHSRDPADPARSGRRIDGRQTTHADLIEPLPVLELGPFVAQRTGVADPAWFFVRETGFGIAPQPWQPSLLFVHGVLAAPAIFLVRLGCGLARRAALATRCQASERHLPDCAVRASGAHRAWQLLPSVGLGAGHQ